MKMSKFSSMTVGLVLILIGIQFFMIKSYLLTPSATRFMAEHMSQNTESRFSANANGQVANLTTPGTTGTWGQAGQQWPYYNTSSNTAVYGNASTIVPQRSTSYADTMPPGYQHRIVPPQWIVWPALFLGTVLFLHGLALRSND